LCGNLTLVEIDESEDAKEEEGREIDGKAEEELELPTLWSIAMPSASRVRCAAMNALL
jgi:hypothetical protein